MARKSAAMKHSVAQDCLSRLYRSLYDGSPEKAAVAAASHALAFVHGIACYNGPASIPAGEKLRKVGIEIEPETVLEPKLELWSNGNAHADPVDERSAAIDRADAADGRVVGGSGTGDGP